MPKIARDEEVRREFQTKLVVPLPLWARAVGMSRGAAYVLAREGKIEGLFKVGDNSYRVATAPWRPRLGIETGAAA